MGHFQVRKVLVSLPEGMAETMESRQMSYGFAWIIFFQSIVSKSHTDHNNL